MQTHFSAQFLSTPQGQRIDQILRACVHCGFCNATCPTFHLTGNELDGPRGRIYLIQQMLEGQEVSQTTQTHLDRCLSCMNCETTCPSGVRYGELLNHGRSYIEAQKLSPASYRGLQWLLRNIVAYPRRLKPLWKLANWLRPILPKTLRPTMLKSGAIQHSTSVVTSSPKQILLIPGCVQSVAAAHVNKQAINILNGCGLHCTSEKETGCCGAIHFHNGDEAGARQMMRDNIKRWSSALNNGIKNLVITASGCAAMIKQYPQIFADEPNYQAAAKAVANALQDISQLIAQSPIHKSGTTWHRIAFHPPCSLQHGLKITKAIEPLLQTAGYELVSFSDPHLCCGSAGTYSILQPEFAGRLRQRKLDSILTQKPDCIATANIGCQLHLQSGSDIPVVHWLELITAER